MSDTPRTGMELLLSSGVTIGEVIARLERELSAAQADSRKLALHTAEQATELGKLRDQLEAAHARIVELEAALKGLHDDTAEYQEINRLGGYDNHWMKAAREALAKEKP